MAKGDQITFEFRRRFPHLEVELLSVDELYNRVEDLLAAGVLGERRRIERKPAGIQPRDIADYIAMFANVPPDGGLILVGVENDGAITGCSGLHLNARNELESAGANVLGARYEVKSVPVVLADGTPDFVLAFRISYCETRAVENSRGDVWLRYGESRKKLSAEEKRELQIAKGQVDYEKEPTALTFPEDFDVDLLRFFTEKYRRAHAINPGVADKDILVSIRLGKLRPDGSFVPNLACALLFATDPRALVPGAYVRFLRFEGEEGSGAAFNPVRDRTIEGPLPALIVRTAEEIETQIRNFTGLGKDDKFYSQPEYPREAWYEAVVNACVHRSYNLRNMNIFVKMFHDRVVIESPGAFPPPVTPENIYDMHLPRNPALMDAMKYLDFVQCAHEGTRRIRDSMQNVGLPAPEFKQDQVGNALVRVTLRNNVIHRKAYVDTDAVNVVGAALFSVLSEQERQLVNFVAANSSINVTEAQRQLGCSWETAKSRLSSLKSRGILVSDHRPGVPKDGKARYFLAGPKKPPNGKR